MINISDRRHSSVFGISRGESIQSLRWTGFASSPNIAHMHEASETDPGNLNLLVLERRDPRVSMARFYVLAIEPTLFDDVALVREWGRIGSKGRRRLDLFAAPASARETLETWLARKIQRGYRRTA